MLKSFQINDTCPMCRTTYLEKDEILEESEDEDEDEDEDEYGYDDEDEEYYYEHVSHRDVPMYDITDKSIRATPTKISEQLQKKGYTMTDIISLLTKRADRQEKRYTQSFLKTMINDVDEIIIEQDECKGNALREREMMVSEDIRTNEINEEYILGSLRLLFNEE